MHAWNWWWCVLLRRVILVNSHATANKGTLHFPFVVILENWLVLLVFGQSYYLDCFSWYWWQAWLTSACYLGFSMHVESRCPTFRHRLQKWCTFELVSICVIRFLFFIASNILLTGLYGLRLKRIFLQLQATCPSEIIYQSCTTGIFGLDQCQWFLKRRFSRLVAELLLALLFQLAAHDTLVFQDVSQLVHFSALLCADVVPVFTEVCVYEGWRFSTVNGLSRYRFPEYMAAKIGCKSCFFSPQINFCSKF